MDENQLLNFYAHSPQGAQRNWEPLAEHSSNVAKAAGRLSKQFDFAELGEVAGMLHDLGKYQHAFQQRLHGVNIAVDHAVCGAKEALEIFQCDSTTLINAFDRELLAYIIAGHHSGLPDCGNQSDAEVCNTLTARLRRKVEDYSAYKNDLPSVFARGYERRLWLTDFTGYISKDRDKKHDQAFAVSILTRMLYSALVDADSLETEKFYTGKNREYKYCTFEALKQKLDSRLNSFPAPKSGSINEKRNEIQKACLDKADSERGIFSLQVPTGGGKTLSSMVFAINHLLRNGHRRIIYVIPYTTIIEQTAKIFKDIFGEVNILEHHSNFSHEDDETKNSGYSSQVYATENWDAPIILTTNVQFFESMFSNKRGASRKIHNITNSVIIFDEAQMLPISYLMPCLKAIDILSRNFGCSALLMSATCPDYRPYLCANAVVTEINDNYKRHYEEFKRTSAVWLGKKSDDELIRLLKKSDSSLIVVNTRRHARELFHALPDDWNKYHLSTLMTPNDRKMVIEEIRHDLANDKPCIVISTQLIECGVDLDFACVYRSLAGIDSIVQAGGRCNREGKRQDSKVYIFEASGDPGRGDIPIYKSIARTICENPKGTDLFDLENINKYFADLLGFKQAETDEKNILELFNMLPPKKNTDVQSINCLRFQFDECSNRFKYISGGKKYEIIINIDKECEELVSNIRYGGTARNTFRKLGKYTVSIYPWEYKKLKQSNKVQMLTEDEHQSVLTDASLYDKNLGLSVETNDDMPVQVF